MTPPYEETPGENRMGRNEAKLLLYTFYPVWYDFLIIYKRRGHFMNKKLITRIVAGLLALILGLSCLSVAVFADEYNPGQNGAWYSSEEFESQYYYDGDDLGATWSAASTFFRVWAPTATAVKLNLYESGTAGTDDLIRQVEMTADVSGTWTATVEGDLNGVYYTYLVDVDGMTNEACDPYARTTGVNGQRAMVIDLDSTDPEGWAEDTDPHYDETITDAIIYELHVRDLSSDASSGIQNVGKFLGLTETGTTNASGQSTGLDHIKNLGITHLHLLPSYDYASVDETRLEDNQFNWGSRELQCPRGLLLHRSLQRRGPCVRVQADGQDPP